MTQAIKINANDGVTRNVMVGGETEVDFDFPIFNASHIQIYETNVAGTIALLVKDTDYTVPVGSVNAQAGGTVDLDGTAYPSGATAGHVFTAYQAAPEQRTTDFNQAGDYFADTLNKELDLVAQQLQQFRRDLNRAALAPVDTTLTSLALPDPVDETVLAWDGVAGAIKSGPTTGEISSAAANAALTAADVVSTNADVVTTNANVVTCQNEAAAAAASAVSAAEILDSALYNDVVFITNADSPYAVTNTNSGDLINVDTSSGAVIINLPEISTLTLPFNVSFKKSTSDANAITVNRGGASDLIDGATSKGVGSVGGFNAIADTDGTPDTWTTASFGAATGDMQVDEFVDGVDFTAGVTTTLTVTSNPGTENNGVLTFDGVTQHHSDWSITGTTLSPANGSAIPGGTSEIEFRYGTTVSIGTPSDATVTFAKLASGAVASQAEAEAGTASDKLMTPERTEQFIDNRIATQAQAEAGSNNTELMTPLRAEQFTDNRLASQAQAEAGTNNTELMTPLRTAQSITENAPKIETVGPVSTSSGSTINIATGLPSGIKKITLIYNQVGHQTGNAELGIQLGDSGGFETSAYDSSSETRSSTSTFVIDGAANAADAINGVYQFFLVDSSANTWVGSGLFHDDNGAVSGTIGCAGRKSLSAELTQVRVNEASANNYDGGEITLIYET